MSLQAALSIALRVNDGFPGLNHVENPRKQQFWHRLRRAGTVCYLCVISACCHGHAAVATVSNGC